MQNDNNLINDLLYPLRESLLDVTNTFIPNCQSYFEQFDKRLQLATAHPDKIKKHEVCELFDAFSEVVDCILAFLVPLKQASDPRALLEALNSTTPNIAKTWLESKSKALMAIEMKSKWTADEEAVEEPAVVGDSQDVFVQNEVKHEASPLPTVRQVSSQLQLQPLESQSMLQEDLESQIFLTLDAENVMSSQESQVSPIIKPKGRTRRISFDSDGENDADAFHESKPNIPPAVEPSSPVSKKVGFS
jgi:hypothetical protein